MAAEHYTRYATDIRYPTLDVETHPDRDLIRMCVALANMRVAMTRLESAIAHEPALTVDGRRMRELSL